MSGSQRAEFGTKMFRLTNDDGKDELGYLRSDGVPGICDTQLKQSPSVDGQD